MKLHHKIFLLLLFFLPTQLGYHFWPQWASVYGIRVDYLSPTIFFTDILTILLLVFWLGERPKILFSKTLVLVFAFVLVNIFLGVSWQVSLYKWLKVGELYLLAFYVCRNWKDLKDKIYLPILLSFLLVLVVSLGQLIHQRTLGGLFYFLGERSFSVSTPGIALANVFGKMVMRPYAVFSHPNSMAGFVFVLLTILISSTKKFTKTFWTLGGILVFVSFSQGAWFVFLVVSLFYLLEKRKDIDLRKMYLFILLFLVFSSLFLPVVSSKLLMIKSYSQTVQQRLELSVISGKVFSGSPIFGVGLGNFITKIPDHWRGFSWWLQPVHNIFLLVLVEGGLVGFLTFAFLFAKPIKCLRKNRLYFLPLIAVGLTGFVDHYWLNLQQNQILLAIVFGLIYSFNCNEKT